MKFTTALPWLCTVLLGVGVYFLYASNRAQKQELLKLNGETIELKQLRLENEDLKNALFVTNEIARLRKENEEIFRLRNEVRQLREEKAQYTKFIEQAQQREAWARQQAEEELLARQAQLVQQQEVEQVDLAAKEQASACIMNLRIIDQGKNQWAIDNGKGPDYTPTEADLYGVGKVLPEKPDCPTGGVYSLNPVGIPVSCSIPEHSIEL